MASRLGLRSVALGYLTLLLGVPVGLVLYRTFEHGLAAPINSLTSADGAHAFWLTLEITAIAVPLNTIFGVATALLLARRKFPGRTFLNGLVDLPFAISPVVVGLVLTTARALGEFGAVSVVSGRLVGQTETLTLRVQNEFERFDLTGAYAASALLAVMAIAVLLVMTALERRRRAT